MSAQARNIGLINEILKHAVVPYVSDLKKLYKDDDFVITCCFYDKGILDTIAKHTTITVSEDGTMSMTVEWGNTIMDEVDHDNVLSYLGEMVLSRANHGMASQVT